MDRRASARTAAWAVAAAASAMPSHTEFSEAAVAASPVRLTTVDQVSVRTMSSPSSTTRR